MEEEIFGPVMTIYIYKDDKFDDTLDFVRRNFTIWPYRFNLQQ